MKRSGPGNLRNIQCEKKEEKIKKKCDFLSALSPFKHISTNHKETLEVFILENIEKSSIFKLI